MSRVNYLNRRKQILRLLSRENLEDLYSQPGSWMVSREELVADVLANWDSRREAVGRCLARLLEEAR